MDGQTGTNGAKSKGKVCPKAEAEGLGDSRASAITQVPVTMDGLVRVGCHRVVLRQGQSMGRGVAQVLRVG